MSSEYVERKSDAAFIHSDSQQRMVMVHRRIHFGHYVRSWCYTQFGTEKWY